MDFVLLVLATGLALVRPGDFVSELDGTQQAYQFVLLGAIAVAAMRGGSEWSMQTLAAHPITVCVAGMVPAIVLSHVANGSMERALDGAIEFAKLLTYHVALVAILNSTDRFRRFLVWLGLWIVVLGAFAYADYASSFPPTPAELAAKERNRALGITEPGRRKGTVFEYSPNPATGEREWSARLGASALDPNDICLMFLTGIAIAAWRVTDRGTGLFVRCGWVGALLFLGYAIQLTQSRGGLLALVAAVVSGASGLFGGWKARLAITLAVVVLLVVFGGRQTDLSSAVGSGTGQSRLQLWSEGLDRIPRQPLFGIGQGEYVTIGGGHVAHNTFIEVFTELGLFGGGCLVAALLSAWRVVVSRARRVGPQLSPTLSHVRPFLLAMLSGYTVGMMSLSEAYILPTYLVLGLVAAYQQLAERSGQPARARLDATLIKRLVFLIPVGFVALVVFVSVNVRWR